MSKLYTSRRCYTISIVFEFILIFLIGLIASFLGSFVSGGTSLIALPSLLTIGLPPHLAFGVYRLGVFGFDLGGFIQYFKNDKIIWPLVLPLSIVAIISGLLGGLLILEVSESLLRPVTGALLLLLLPLALFKPTFGLERETTSATKQRVGYGLFGIFSIYGASFTLGQGMFLTYVIVSCFGLPLLNTIATAKIPSALTSLAALLVFGLNGLIDWQLALFLFLGMLTGSYIGAHFAIKLGNYWLRAILLVAIGALGVKLILGW